MQVRFHQNVGLLDIKRVKDATGVQLDPQQCKEGCVCDIPQNAVDVLTHKRGGLLSPVAVKGESKKSELTAPAK